MTVVYAARPTPDQQGAGFDLPFEWDTPLLDGYAWHAGPREPPEATNSRPADFAVSTFRQSARRSTATRPDVDARAGLALDDVACARCSPRGAGALPMLYRGDTNNGTAPPDGGAPSGTRRRGRCCRSIPATSLSGAVSRTYLESHGVAPTRIFASPHAVDNDVVCGERRAAPDPAPAARRRGPRAAGGPDDFIVLFAGKLEARKRPLDAVRAVAALGPNAVLAVAGWGELDGDDAAPKPGGWACASRWLGFVNQSMIGRVYAGADCLVLPSGSSRGGSSSTKPWRRAFRRWWRTALAARPTSIVPGETGEVCRTGDVERL